MRNRILAALAVMLFLPALAGAQAPGAPSIDYEPSRSALPNGSTVNAGTGSARATVGGVLNVNTTSQATTGTAEEVLATYTLPANTLSANGKGVRIIAFGASAANANVKITRIRFGGIGGTIIAALSFSSSAASWRLSAEVVRTGAATQITTSQSGSGATSSSQTVSASQTLSGTVDIVVTGVTATSAGDATFQGLIVEALN